MLNLASERSSIAPTDFEANLHLARSSGAIIINKLESQAAHLEQARTVGLGAWYSSQCLCFLAGYPHSGAAAVEAALGEGAVGAALFGRAQLSELAQTGSGANPPAALLDRVTDDDGRACSRLRRGGAPAAHLRARRDAASVGRALRRARRPSLAQAVRQPVIWPTGMPSRDAPCLRLTAVLLANLLGSTLDRVGQLYGDATRLVERGRSTRPEVCASPSAREGGSGLNACVACPVSKGV